MKIELHRFAKLYSVEENDPPCIIGIQRGNTIFTRRLPHISSILEQDNYFCKMLVQDFYIRNGHIMITAEDR